MRLSENCNEKTEKVQRTAIFVAGSQLGIRIGTAYRNICNRISIGKPKRYSVPQYHALVSNYAGIFFSD